MLYGAPGVGKTMMARDLIATYEYVENLVDNYCTLGFNAFERCNSSGYLLELKDRLMASEMDRYYQMAKELLVDNREFLDSIIRALLDKKCLLQKEIKGIKRF